MLAQALVYRDASHETLVLQLERHARRRPDHPFLRYESREVTYAQAATQVALHARAHAALGTAAGDVVALMMENRPEFLWHVLGLQKLGAVAALINTNATGEALVHALRVCDPKRVVLGAEVIGQLGEREPEGEWREWLDARVRVDVEGDPVAHLRPAASEGAQRPRLGDVGAYIFTSGTSGLPKPAVIRHARFYRAGRAWGALAFRLAPEDVLYTCLPLYHGNALMLATGSVVTFGATLALSRRFSARAFWDEVRQHRATSFVYVGELCRYLLAAPPDPRDRDHGVRVISGNGLRAELWPLLQRRFGIERIAEFYGATEGNCLTINVGGPVGSVGKMLPGMALARWDFEAGALARDADGRVARARPGEAGVLLGRIRGASRFDGYRDRAASEKKIVRDAFSPGDAWFDTGDLMRVDARRNLFFVDRLGDTFRWKGENVSTLEVEAALARWPGAGEVNVYGVAVGSTEGRAGMAAMVLAGGARFDADGFRRHVDATLPPYARPLFVRLLPRMDTTGTLKLQKGRLQAEGFDPATAGAALFVRHPGEDAFVALDARLHADVVAGRMRL
jgi:acyl-CoA synthetase (AMP-forming)/AMP-acid ligase II